MDSLQLFYPMVVGYVVSPAVTWLKAKVNVDYPILWWFITLVINAIFVFGVAALFMLKGDMMGMEEVMQFLIAQVSSQLTHAVKKNKKKTEGKLE